MESLIGEYIKIMKRTRILNDVFNYAAYKYIQQKVGVVDLYKFNNGEEGSEENIGKAFIEYNNNDLCVGFDWKFNSYQNPEYIIITYSTIMNKYGAIKEDNTAIVTFDEFEKYI